MGPAPTSPRALHGWTLEALSYSFRSCRAGTSVVRVLSWAKPCSASWDLCVVCTFLKKKVLPFGCSPRASCCLAQGAGGSFLEIALILRRRAPEHIPGFFVKKSSDIAMSGFFLSCGLEVVCLEEVFWMMCAFFEEKSALTECSPRASCYLEQKVGGSWILCCFEKLLSWWSLLSDVRFLKEKVHSLSVAPEPLARFFYQKELGYRLLACSLVVCCCQM